MSDIDFLADTPSILSIQIQTCQKYGVTLPELIGAQRTQKLVIPRHEAMYRAKKETLASLPQIGRAFGGRDHTTVIHAVRRHEKRVGNGAS